MKVKISITLSDELINIIDSFSKEKNNRSIFIENALWAYIEQINRKKRDERDKDIYNKHLDILNKEAMDVLDYQIDQ